MHQIRHRSYFCPKVGEKVELVEYVRGEDDLPPVCGIISCSHQDQCARAGAEGGEPVFQWGDCPASREKQADAEAVQPGAGAPKDQMTEK